jgi:F-type H+-transporting ATPase subunit epsilon
MEKTELHLRIISPSRTEYDGHVTMVVLPGSEGEFGVLPYHAPMIASLQSGNIQIHKDGHIAREVKITSGVASISASGVDVLLSE